MKVLMITGDKNFFASSRFALQAAHVERLALVYIGRGALWSRVPSGSFDVITSQDPFWRGLFAWWVARRLGAKLNIQVHTDLLALSVFRQWWAGIILRRADSVRVVSEKIKIEVVSMGVHMPVTVLPVLVDLDSFTQLPRTPHEKKTILWVGRFEAEKDPLGAITILQEVLKERDTVKLIMLGSGSLEESLKQFAKHLPVEFPGWRDPRMYLPVADVVLCTSKHESYGVSIVEALAAGVSVVAPDVGVAKEAGAAVVARGELASKVLDILQTDNKGVLRFPLLTSEEWVTQWKESLI